MSLSKAETRQLVESRAGHRCEYCRMHQSLQGASFHVEHITPISLGGTDDLDNLAWACPGCNLKKSVRVTVVDLVTGMEVRLFHPRLDLWQEHFAWQEYILIGLTPLGRALIAAFDLNHERRCRVRQAEELFGLFPPS
ncbi:MAG: HNH endonuclease [Candidatus Binatia bacterium]